MVDANAAVGEIQTQGIGDLDVVNEDYNGSRLRELTSALGLCLPSTFPMIHWGPTDTWFSSASKKISGNRLDYIAIPLDWLSHKTTSQTLPDLDVAQANIDHVAILIDIVTQPIPKRKSPAGSQANRQPKIHWPAVRTCRSRETWDRVFSDLPQPSWEADVHEHWHQCHQQLCQRLEQIFPKPKSAPRKPYISDDVWQLRQQKQALRRQAALRSHLCPRLELTAGFYVWKQQAALRALLFRTTLWLLRCHAAHYRDLKQHRILQKELRLALQQQRVEYLETIADEASQAPPHQLYAKLRKAGFSSSRRTMTRPLPMLLDAQGTAIDDPQQLQETWRQYFAGIECGHHVRHEELLQLCIYTELECYKKPTEAFLRALPTLHSLEHAFRRCRPHRAAGPDRIPPELGRYATRWFSHYLAPLFLKCCLYTAEPVHFKGGVLHEIWKRRGPTTKPESYRGILVSSHVAKTFHNVFREPRLAFHAKEADALQFGGRPHQGVDFASHTLQTYMSLAAGHKRSCGIFFLDIKSAYYRLLRTLAVGPTCTTEELAKVLQTMGLPLELLDLLERATTRTCALDATGCPPWLRDFGNHFHRHTWFTTRNSDEVTMTLRGTRPGDGFADLLFNLVAGKILRQLEEELHFEGVQTKLCWNGRFGFFADFGEDTETNALNIVWADDVAVLLQHESPQDLIDIAQVTMTRYIEKLAEHGLLLNFDSGKTELLLLLRGTGSRGLRRELFQVEHPHIQINPKGFGQIQVKLVDRYKHLGSVVHASGRIIHELRVRVGQAHSAFNQHRRAVYHNKALSLARRVQIFRTCVLSVLYWNCCTWPPLRDSDAKYFYAAVARLVRRLLVPTVPFEDLLRWTPARLFATVDLLEPALHIRTCRLSYFGRLLRHGPEALWALLATDRHWYDQITQDMHWYTENCQSTIFRPPFGHPDTTILAEPALEQSRHLEGTSQKGTGSRPCTSQDCSQSRPLWKEAGTGIAGLPPGPETSSELPREPCKRPLLLPSMPKGF